jgi:hypothetical protein
MRRQEYFCNCSLEYVMRVARIYSTRCDARCRSCASRSHKGTCIKTSPRFSPQEAGTSQAFQMACRRPRPSPLVLSSPQFSAPTLANFRPRRADTAIHQYPSCELTSQSPPHDAKPNYLRILPSRNMLQAPKAGPIAKTISAWSHPTRATSSGTRRMGSRVRRKPRLVCMVRAVPT